MVILVGGSVLRMGRNHSKRVAWCKICGSLLHDMILSLFVRGFSGVEVRFSWQAQGIVRLLGVAEVAFRGRRSTLCMLDVWTRKFSWQAQEIVRLRVVVEVNVAVTLVSGRCLEGLESRNCLAGLLDVCVCAPMGLLEEVSYETLVLEALTRDFSRKSRMKRSFWRLDE